MNHIYRLVWNAAVQGWIAAAENVRAGGRAGSGRRRLQRAALLALPAAGLGFAALAQTAVVAPGQRTTAYTSANGVTVVDIANPNAAGVSHNRFQRFDVEARGLVLNNTTAGGAITNASLLAGSVLANQNTAQAARVIVNEVVSARRSVLAGFTEVVGGKADVVVANPYGITCNSCGFINTDRVTLTTGLPRWAGDGSLQGLDVSGGDILVGAAGLNASAQQVLDLVTRKLTLQGSVHGKDVGVFAGKLQWNYADRSATAGAPGGDAPAYAIDASALGGMYANSIRLVATEAGVGVRMLGAAAASAGDFAITAAGKVELRGRVSATRDVLVASADSGADALTLAAAALTAGRQIELVADGGVAVAGSTLVAVGDLGIGAGAGGIALADSRLTGRAKLGLAAQDGAVAVDRSTLVAGQALAAFGSSVATGAASQWSSGGTLQVTATDDLALGAAAVRAKGDVVLAASGDLALGAGAGQGVQSDSGVVALVAGGRLDNAGTVTAGTDLVLRAGSALANTGTLHAGGAIDAGASGSTAPAIVNDGQWLAGGALRLQAGDLVNRGLLQGANVTAVASQLTNSGTLMATQGDATLQVAGSIANTGRVQAARDLGVAGVGGAAAQALTNEGLLLAGAAIDVRAAALANRAGALIQAGTDAGLRATSLHNAGSVLAERDANFEVAATLAQTGTLQAGRMLSATADRVENAGDIAAAQDLRLAMAALQNQAGGQVVAGGRLAVAGQSLDNAAGARLQSRLGADVSVQQLANTGTLLLAQAAGQDAQVAVAGTFTNSGAVQSAAGLDLAAGTLANTGSVAAVGALAIAADSVANGGSLQADGDLSLTAQALANSGTIASQAAAQVFADAFSNLAGGAIRGASSLDAEFGAAGLANHGVLQAGTGAAGELATLNLWGHDGGALTNAGHLQGGTIAATAASLANQGTITAGAGGASFVLAGAFSNAASGVVSLGGSASAGSLVSGTSIVNAGLLQGQGAVAFAAGSGGLQSTGSVLAGSDLWIESLGGGDYTATLGGPVKVAGVLHVRGGAGSKLALTGAGEVRATSADVQTGTLELGARTTLMSQGAMSVDVDALALAQETETDGALVRVYTGRLLGAMGGDAADLMDVKVAGTFDNQGLVHSGNDLRVTAPHVRIREGAALSALRDLAVTANAGQLDLAAAAPDAAAGTLLNEGRLYAGRVLGARANGVLTNTSSIEAGDTIDLLAHTVVNHRDIDSLGDLRVVATRLRNEVAGGDRRVFRSTWNPATAVWNQFGGQWDDNGDGGNLDKARNYEAWYDEYLEFLPGEMPTHWPQMTAQRRAELYFNKGSNLGGLIQGVQSVHLQGFAASTEGTPLIDGLRDDLGRHLAVPTGTSVASFENNSLAQVVTHKARYHTQTRKEAGMAGGDVIDDWNWCAVGSDAVCNGDDDHTGYIVPVDIVRGVTPILPAGYAGARIYTASLSGNGFVLFNEGSTTPAQFQPAALRAGGTVPTRGVGLIQPGPLPSTTLPGTGTQSGWTPVSTEIHAVTVTGAQGQALLAGLTFGGIQVAFPTGSNGMYVLATDPQARYLVETNPLYQVGARVAGSDYLRERLGIDIDQTTLRLGDGSYETWLVQRQLIAQTGSMLLKGQTNLDAQMRALMDNAALAAAELGLLWGQALTPAQQAALKQDIVWMVRSVVDGKEVLVPVVYLSQATKDGIRKGAIIAADEGSLQVEGLANSGTITGVTIDNSTTRRIAGPSGSLGMPMQYRDQSFEIVKAYLLSESSDKTIRFGDVNEWLARNGSNAEALGQVLPYAFQRFIGLATGGGVLSENDKAFVAYVGEYAKQQRLAAIDQALATYDAWKKGPKLGQHGKHALLTSLFDLGESPPDTIMQIAQAGITISDREAKQIGAIVGSSLGAGALGGVAGGSSAALMNQIFPFLHRALQGAGSSITAFTTASGPLAIVTAAAAIAGQAIAKVVKDANFEKDLRKLKAEYEGVAGNDVGFWLKQDGGPEQLMLSMAKLMAANASEPVVQAPGKGGGV